MDDFNNKLLLKELAANKDLLLQEIEKTEGYVLHNMEQSQVFPPIEFLLSPPNVLSLNFLVKNYKLDKDQFILINKMLRSGSGASNVITLSEAEVEEFLIKKLILPENTIISFSLLKKYALTAIPEQYNLDEHITERIVTKSLSLLDIPSLLSLDKGFLIKHIDVLQGFKSHFNNLDYKKAFLELAKSELSELNINNFRNFPFTKDDLPLLKTLLNSSNSRYWTKGYEEVSKITGVAELISKVDYLEYNPIDYKSFSDAELSLHKKEIQKVILKHVTKKESSGLWGALTNLDISLDGFKEIIDLDIFSKFMNAKKDYSMRQVYREDSEARQKEHHLNKLAVMYCVENPAASIRSDKLDISDNLYGIQKYLDSQHNYNNDNVELIEFLKYAQRFYLEVVPTYFKTNLFSTNLFYLERFIKDQQYPLAKEMCEKFPSVNLLYYLLSNYGGTKKTNSSYGYNAHLKELIEITASYIEPKLRKQLFKHFNFSSTNKLVKYITSKLSPPTTTPAPSNPSSSSTAPTSAVTIYNPMSPENNFLNYENIPIEELNSVTNIIYFSSDFRKYILKNNLSLSHDTLSTLIYNLEKTEAATLPFLQKYVAQHLDEIKAVPDLVTKIRSHALGSSILPPPSVEEEEAKFNRLLDLIEEIKVRTKIEAAKKAALKKTKKTRDDAQYYSDKEKTSLEHELRQETSSLSFSYLGKKVSQLLKSKDFSTLRALSLSKEHTQLIRAYIEKLNYSDLMSNISNPDFIALLKSFSDDDRKPSIRFASFNSIESQSIAKSLLPHFERPYHILYLFGNKNQDFIKSFAIEHCYHEVFYGYSLIYSTSSFGNRENLITSPYSPEEVLQAYLNLEKTEGLFGYRDTNARHYQLYKSNFENNEENYLKMLDLARPYPKFYLQLIHYDTLSHLRPRDPKEDWSQNSFEKICHLNFNNYIDIDLAIEGAKEVLHDCLNAKEEYYDDDTHPENATKRIVNKNLAMNSLSQLTGSTYYRVTNPATGQDTYMSAMPEEGLKKLLCFLVNDAPYFLMGLHSLGPYPNLSEHIKDNIAQYIDPAKSSKEVIDSILFPPSELRPEYFSSSQDDRFSSYIVGVVGGLINMYLSQGKMDEINYIIHVLEQNDFIEKSIDYDLKYSRTSKNREIVSFLNENKEINKLLEVPKSKIMINKLIDFKAEPVLEVVKKKSNKI